jgi:hypothetical protein
MEGAGLAHIGPAEHHDAPAAPCALGRLGPGVSMMGCTASISMALERFETAAPVRLMPLEQLANQTLP